MSDVIAKMKKLGMLSDAQLDLGNVPSGSYALNKVISGNYKDGYPIGGITQIIGEASTAKTVFVISALREAQKLGYHTILIDAENSLNSEFAAVLGLDPTRLIYPDPPPETIEECFTKIEELILAIREDDKDTPIVVGYDSLAVSPCKYELDKKEISDKYDSANTAGAIRAKAIGTGLRIINSILRPQKVCFLVINQFRSKIGVMYGDPRTAAAGGKALDFYLRVNLETKSNKGTDLIKDDCDNVIGIEGKIENKKNKESLPYRNCEFKLMFDQGLVAEAGLIQALVSDKLIERAGAWYTVKENNFKFQSTNFLTLLKTDPHFQSIRNLIGILS